MKLTRYLFFVPAISFFIAINLDAAGPLSRFFGGSKKEKSDQSSLTHRTLKSESKTSFTDRSNNRSSKDLDPANRLKDIKRERKELKKQKPTAKQEEALTAREEERVFGRAKGAQSAREKYSKEFKEIDALRAKDKALKDEKKELKRQMKQSKGDGVLSKFFGKKSKKSSSKDDVDVHEKKSEKLKVSGEKKPKPSDDLSLDLGHMSAYDADAKIEKIKKMPKDQQLKAANKALKKTEEAKNQSLELQKERRNEHNEADLRMKERNPELYEAFTKNVITARKVAVGEDSIKDVQKRDIPQESKDKIISKMEQDLEKDKQILKKEKDEMNKVFGKDNVKSFKKEWRSLDEKRVNDEKIANDVRDQYFKMNTLVNSLQREQAQQNNSSSTKTD